MPLYAIFFSIQLVASKFGFPTASPPQSHKKRKSFTEN